MHFDILGHLSAFGGGVAGYLVPFLFVLTIVVFFHELGHFLVARACGIRVLTFSIGFGPELCGFNDRYGTRWKLSAVPLGGYVKFFGDDNGGERARQGSDCRNVGGGKKIQFRGQPVRRARTVVAAGPVANFILAIVIFAGIFMVVGKQTTSARVDTVQPESAAATAGFQPGDLVVAIDGSRIDSFADMQRIVSTSAGENLAIEVERGGVHLTLKATPALKELKDNFGNVHRLGILGISRSTAAGDVKTEHMGPFTAVAAGAEETWFVVDRTLSYIGGVFASSQGSCRSARRSDPDRPGFRTGRNGGACGPDAPHGGAFGLDWPAEPVSNPAARRGSPFVLWNRGCPWPPTVGKGARGGLSHRLGHRRHVDDFCNL